MKTIPNGGPRQRAEQLIGALRDSSTAEASMIREVLDLLYSEAREEMVRADGDHLLRVQGEARVLRKLYNQFTYNPMSKE